MANPIEFVIDKSIASFAFFSALLIASLISLFSVLSKKNELKEILEREKGIFWLILFFVFGLICKSIFSFFYPNVSWIYDLIPFGGLVLFDLWWLIKIKKEEVDKRANEVIYMLILNLAFILGWSLAGAFWWYYHIYPINVIDGCSKITRIGPCV